MSDDPISPRAAHLLGELMLRYLEVKNDQVKGTDDADRGVLPGVDGGPGRGGLLDRGPDREAH